MKIHSDSLDLTDIRKAATLAGVGFTRLDQKGSRSRAVAFDLILTGNSGRRQNFGGEDEAATWDEWGIFLGHLHRLDPNLRCAYYFGEDHYVWATGGRFTPDFTPADQHHNHKWGLGVQNVTGSYAVSTCEGRNGCGAIRRYLTGAKWEDLNAA